MKIYSAAFQDEFIPFPGTELRIGYMVDPGPALFCFSVVLMGDEIDQSFNTSLPLADECRGNPRIIKLPGKLLSIPNPGQLYLLLILIEQSKAGIYIFAPVFPSKPPISPRKGSREMFEAIVLSPQLVCYTER